MFSMHTKKGNDGFFNLHTISFMTIVVGLTIFSVVYGDWYYARITGHVVEDWTSFFDTYIKLYETYLTDENYLPDPYYTTLANCISSEGTDCLSLAEAEAGLETGAIEACANGGDCQEFANNYLVGVILDPENSQQHYDENIEGYEITDECDERARLCLEQDTTPEGICPGPLLLCFEGITCNYLPDYCYVPEVGGTSGSTQPPKQVVEEVSRDTDVIVERSDYVSGLILSIGKTATSSSSSSTSTSSTGSSSSSSTTSSGASVSTDLSSLDLSSLDSLAETDLLRLDNLVRGTLRDMVYIRDGVFLKSSKYKSSQLSSYQVQIDKEISKVEKVLNKVQSNLVQTVSERQERQVQNAIWTLDYEEKKLESMSSMEEYLSKLPPIVGEQGSEQPLGQQSGYFSLEIADHETLVIENGQPVSSEIVIINHGDFASRCDLEVYGSFGEEYNMEDYFYFPQGSLISYIPPATEEENGVGVIPFELYPPDEIPGGIYFADFSLICTEGEVNGFTLKVEVTFTYVDRYWYFYEALIESNLPSDPITGNIVWANPQCEEDVNFCLNNEESCPEYISSCIEDPRNGCEEFYVSCIEPGISAEIESGSTSADFTTMFNYFLVNYVEPYLDFGTGVPEGVEFTNPACSVEAFGACLQNFQNCPPFTSSCIVNGYDPDNEDPTHFSCLNFLNYCSQGQIEGYSSRFSSFNQEFVAPYYNLPESCLVGISACSSSPINCQSPYYECIVDGNCEEYENLCLSVSQQSNPGSSSGYSGSSGSGGSSSGGGVVIPPTDQEQPILGCQGDQRCENLIRSGDCLTPTYIFATGLDFEGFDGGFGLRYDTLGRAELCYIGGLDIFLKPIRDVGLPGGSGSSGSGSGSGGVGLPGSSGGIIAINFEEKNVEGRVVYSSAILRKDQNGLLTLNFLSSPNYNDLERKIYEFIEKVLYGEGTVEGIFITGLSVQQAEEIVNSSVSIPWVLWLILFVMIVSFLFLGNSLAPYNERLISSGKKALHKGNYPDAVAYYNKLAQAYSNDLSVKQDALNYLKLIKDKTNNKINLEFSDKNSLPKIKVSSSSSFSNYHKVEKMIDHALQDLNKNSKNVKGRMPIIAEEYRKLDRKEREKLASGYEKLVYKIKHFKSK